MESVHLNKEACFVSFFLRNEDDERKPTFPSGHESVTATVSEGKTAKLFCWLRKKKKENKKGTV